MHTVSFVPKFLLIFRNFSNINKKSTKHRRFYLLIFGKFRKIIRHLDMNYTLCIVDYLMIFENFEKSSRTWIRNTHYVCIVPDDICKFWKIIKNLGTKYTVCIVDCLMIFNKFRKIIKHLGTIRTNYTVCNLCIVDYLMIFVKFRKIIQNLGTNYTLRIVDYLMIFGKFRKIIKNLSTKYTLCILDYLMIFDKFRKIIHSMRRRLSDDTWKISKILERLRFCMSIRLWTSVWIVYPIFILC